jgi:hypothetical protein
MKKLVIATSISFTLLSLNACQSMVKGSGKSATKAFTVANFDGVLSDLAADVKIICDSSKPFSCTITADDNIVGLLKAEVAKGELLLTSNGQTSYSSNIPIVQNY